MATNELIPKLDRLLAQRLREYQSGLIPASMSDRIIGFIVSADFEDLDHAERQRRLKSLLSGFVEAGLLTQTEHGRIGPVVTMTPVEAHVDEVVD